MGRRFALVNGIYKEQIVEHDLFTGEERIVIPGLQDFKMTREEFLRYIKDPFGKGYVVRFKAASDVGKTSGMIGYACWLLTYAGYKGWEVIGNLTFKWPGDIKLDNRGLRDKIQSILYDDEGQHLIIMADEIDSVFPARFFKKEAQTENLLNLWQATKRRLYFLYTSHEGTTEDKIIRDCTNFGLWPRIDLENDRWIFNVINAVDNIPSSYDLILEPASMVLDKYIRNEPVK